MNTPSTNFFDFTSFEGWEAHMKNRTHNIKKQTGCKQGHAYEEVAKIWGFNTYAALRTAAKNHFGI